MSKQAILDRLQRYPAEAQARPARLKEEPRPQAELAAQFSKNLQAVKGQVIRCDQADLQARLNQLIADHAIRRMCAGTHPDLDSILRALPSELQLTRLKQPIEGFKQEMFADMDAALTTCDGALAETGSIVLYSDPMQPRTLSLLPPIHIVLLYIKQIHANLSTWFERSDLMPLPTNLLLISGPSKSADIEQVLAYGVHGPKQLIVMLIE